MLITAAAIAAGAVAYVLRRRFSERVQVTPAGAGPVAPPIDSADGGESMEAAGTATP
jgi:hypothetical protein